MAESNSPSAEYAGAIYHAMSRGNASGKVFLGDGDYQQWEAGLQRTVE